MSLFVDAYLSGLHVGMTKQASLVGGIRPFTPATTAAVTGALGTFSGIVPGAVTGMIAGGVGNAALGKEKKDPKTGKTSNGVLARLMKGTALGAAAGIGTGVTIGGAIGGFNGYKSISKLHAGISQVDPVASDLLKSITVEDLYNKFRKGKNVDVINKLVQRGTQLPPFLQKLLNK